MTATQQQIRGYLNKATRALQSLFDSALEAFADVTLDARQCMAAEASLVLWAAQRRIPCGKSLDGSRLEVRPLGELGPVFVVMRAVRL